MEATEDVLKVSAESECWKWMRKMSAQGAEGGVKASAESECWKWVLKASAKGAEGDVKVGAEGAGDAEGGVKVSAEWACDDEPISITKDHVLLVLLVFDVYKIWFSYSYLNKIVASKQAMSQNLHE